VTHHQLSLTKEQEAAEAADAARQRALAAKREVDEASYGRLVETQNVNRWAPPSLPPPSLPPSRPRPLTPRPGVTAPPPGPRRQEDTVEARSMDAAIDALTTLSTSEAAQDRHPEK
jgi:hypothetical protein